jgi:hypothetical protein
MTFNPVNGLLYVGCLGSGPTLFEVDLVQSKITPISTTTGSINGLHFETATGDLIASGTDTPFQGVVRMTTKGATLGTVSNPPGGGWGFPSGLDGLPTPLRYGNDTTKSFAVRWDLPAPNQRLAVASSLPTPGNNAFALALSSHGFDLAGVVVLAAGRTPIPGLPILDGLLHLDPQSMFAVLPVAGSDAITLPLPIPPNTGGATVFAQGFFLDGLQLAFTSGLRITVID